MRDNKNNLVKDAKVTIYSETLDHWSFVYTNNMGAAEVPFIITETAYGKITVTKDGFKPFQEEVVLKDRTDPLTTPVCGRPNPNGAKPKDVFELPTLSNHSWEKTVHPTQKPVELIKKIILASSNQDSLVIDPFGGSGTTFATAEALHRKWSGTELSPEYCEIIKARLNDTEHIERILKGKQEFTSCQG